MVKLSTLVTTLGIKNKFTNGSLIGIILFVFLSHGLLLLNDGIYWDAALTHFYLEDPTYSELILFTKEAGIPETAYFHIFANLFPDRVFAYKFFTFFSILSNAILIFKIASLWISKANAVKIACLSAVYPAFQVSIMSSMMQYHLDYTLFLLGAWLQLSNQYTLSPNNQRKYFIRRITSLLLFAASFTLNSLLVFYFGFIILYFLSQQHKNLNNPAMFFVRNIDFLLLPFLYWYLKNLFFPTFGAYTTYNQFNFSFEIMKWTATVFFTSSVLRPFVYEIPLYLTILILSIGLILLKKQAYNSILIKNSVSSDLLLLTYGLFLLLCGTLPYILVGKPPHPDSMDTRNALLVALPMSIIIFSIVEMISHASIRFFIVYFLVVGFLLQSTQNYINWQARWVKDRSIILNMSDHPTLKKSSIIWVENDHYHIEGTDWFYTSDWSGIARSAFGDEHHAIVGRPFVNSEEEIPLTGFSPRYLTSGVDSSGCRAKISIFKGDRQHDNFGLVIRYYYYRFLQPSQMSQFLSPIVYLNVKPIQSTLATNCKQW